MISSIVLDILLEYSISLSCGPIHYMVDYGSYISYLTINEHFTIICLILPCIIISYINSILQLTLTNRKDKHDIHNIFNTYESSECNESTTDIYNYKTNNRD